MYDLHWYAAGGVWIAQPSDSITEFKATVRRTNVGWFVTMTTFGMPLSTGLHRRLFDAKAAVQVTYVTVEQGARSDVPTR